MWCGVCVCVCMCVCACVRVYARVYSFTLYQTHYVQHECYSNSPSHTDCSMSFTQRHAVLYT